MRKQKQKPHKNLLVCSCFSRGNALFFDIVHLRLAAFKIDYFVAGTALDWSYTSRMLDVVVNRLFVWLCVVFVLLLIIAVIIVIWLLSTELLVGARRFAFAVGALLFALGRACRVNLVLNPRVFKTVEGGRSSPCVVGQHGRQKVGKTARVLRRPGILLCEHRVEIPRSQVAYVD